MSVLNRIEQAAELAGIGKRQLRGELATACGISYQSVAQWFNGRTKDIDADNLAKVAKRLNVTVDWLLTGKVSGVSGASNRLSIVTTKTVALVDKRHIRDWIDFHKGAMIQPPSIVEELPINMDLPPSAFALELDDAAMEPEFKQGDTVIFDPNLTPYPAEPVAASVNGEPTIMRQYREVGFDQDGRMIVELLPSNPAYPTYRSDTATIDVQGVFVVHQRYNKRRV